MSACGHAHEVQPSPGFTIGWFHNKDIAAMCARHIHSVKLVTCCPCSYVCQCFHNWVVSQLCGFTIGWFHNWVVSQLGGFTIRLLLPCVHVIGAPSGAHVLMCAQMHVCPYTRWHTHTFTLSFSHTHTHTYAHTHTRTHTYTHTPTHIAHST